MPCSSTSLIDARRPRAKGPSTRRLWTGVGDPAEERSTGPVSDRALECTLTRLRGFDLAPSHFSADQAFDFARRIELRRQAKNGCSEDLLALARRLRKHARDV